MNSECQVHLQLWISKCHSSTASFRTTASSSHVHTLDRPRQVRAHSLFHCTNSSSKFFVWYGLAEPAFCEGATAGQPSCMLCIHSKSPLAWISHVTMIQCSTFNIVDALVMYSVQSRALGTAAIAPERYNHPHHSVAFGNSIMCIAMAHCPRTKLCTI